MSRNQFGHTALAEWFAEGYRSGRLTDDGAVGDPFALGCTLAAVDLFTFVEDAETTGRVGNPSGSGPR